MKRSWKVLEAELPPMGGIRKSVMLEGQTKMYYVERVGDIENTCICLHGVAGTSRSWIPLLNHFPESPRVLIVDLPGFGKSHTTQSVSDYLQFWVSALHDFVRHLGITRARWLGHSLGAFIAIALAHAHPQLVQTLVLISPAGIFPTLGPFGYYFSVVFKLGFPYVLRAFRAVVYVLSHFVRYREWMYFLICYCDRKTFAHHALQQFIHLHWRKTFWTNFKLVELLELAQLHGIPISLIYGEHDPLTPYHQGVLLRSLHPTLEIRKIPSAGHTPIADACSEIIAATYRSPVQMDLEERYTLQQRLDRIRAFVRSKTFEQNKWSSWNPMTTMRNIETLYSALLALK